MPLVGIEEGEDLRERFIGNVDLRIVPLQIVHVEQAAVEIRDLAEQLRQFRGRGRPPADPAPHETASREKGGRN